MAYAMTVHHGTCHGTTMARHMDALPWCVAAGLSVHCAHQSPYVLLAMDIWTPHDAGMSLPSDGCVRSWHCHGPAEGLALGRALNFQYQLSPNACHGTARAFIGFHGTARRLS